MPRRPSPGNIASPYGPRRHPITGKPATPHTGEDIGHSAGVAIVAPLECTVTSYGPYGGYGNRMVVVGTLAGDRIEVWLCHLAASVAPVGFTAPEGHRLATMGTTGNSTGVHLHWEVRVNGVRVNPAAWLASAHATALALNSHPITPNRKRKMEYTLVQAPGLGAFIIRASDGAVRSILGVEVEAQKAAGVDIATVPTASLKLHIDTHGYQTARPKA